MVVKCMPSVYRKMGKFTGKWKFSWKILPFPMKIMCSSKLGLLAAVALLLGHRAAAFGPPASHDDDVKRTSNSKWGKAYWAGRGDADAITVEIYQKEDDCKTGRITDTSAVRALFRSWWLLNPHASQSNAVQYEDEHTKEFHMQVRVECD